MPPPRSPLIVRPRLRRALDKCISRPATVISAPAGFGKTTLLANALEARRAEYRIAWLSLDEEDSEPGRFFQYLLAALQTVAPSLRASPLSVFGGLQMPSPRLLMTLLIPRITKTSKQIVLVLDDYHLVSNVKIHAAVTYLIERLPSHVRVVIASREEPSLPIARWRSRELVSEIGLGDLRFTDKEAAQFLGRGMRLHVDGQAMQVLQMRTEGWVAGLQMAALSMQQPNGTKASIDVRQNASRFGGTHRYVIDYLAAEVIRQQPEEVLHFLSQTAILDRLCAPLCDAVTKRTDGSALLARLERANMFVLRLDEERRWYRYHQLFSDFLRAYLPANGPRELHVNAAAWYEANGLYEDAMKHARAADDLDAAIRIFRALADDALSRGEVSKLLAWLESLPADLVGSHSDLAGYMAWLLYLRGRTVEAELYATRAYEPEDSNAPPVHKGMLSTIHAFIELNWGDLGEATALARRAVGQLEGTTSFFRTYAVCLLGQAQRLAGDRLGAIETLNRAIRLGRDLGNHLMTVDAIGHVVPLMYGRGELREAKLLCSRAIKQYSDNQGAPLPVAGMLYVLRGMLAYESNELSASRQDLGQGIELARQIGMVVYVLMGLRALARLLHFCGERDAAWSSIAEARVVSQSPESKVRRRLVEVVAAELHLREGNFDAAARSLGESARLSAMPLEEESLVHARLLLAKHQQIRALNLLSQLARGALDSGFSGSLITIHVVQALCHRAQGNAPAALEFVEKAVSLAASSGYRHSFLDEGSALRPLLEKARHVAPAFVSELLDASSEMGATVVSASTLPEPLKRTEREIVGMIDRGMTNKEIAPKLKITAGTVKWHLRNIFGKLQVHNRTGAVAKARELGLL